MASLTVTVTPAGGAGVSFGVLSSASGRHAYLYEPGMPEQDNKLFHIPGVAGSYLVRGGRTGTPVHFIARYVGAYATAIGYYASDRASFAATTCTVTDGTEAFARARLVAAQRLAPPKCFKLSGTDKIVFFDVLFRFVDDA